MLSRIHEFSNSLNGLSYCLVGSCHGSPCVSRLSTWYSRVGLTPDSTPSRPSRDERDGIDNGRVPTSCSGTELLDFYLSRNTSVHYVIMWMSDVSNDSLTGPLPMVYETGYGTDATRTIDTNSGECDILQTASERVGVSSILYPSNSGGVGVPTHPGTARQDTPRNFELTGLPSVLRGNNSNV